MKRRAMKSQAIHNLVNQFAGFILRLLPKRFEVVESSEHYSIPAKGGFWLGLRDSFTSQKEFIVDTLKVLPEQCGLPLCQNENIPLFPGHEGSSTTNLPGEVITAHQQRTL